MTHRCGLAEAHAVIFLAVLGGLLAVGLLAYLIYALLKPEKF